MEHTVSLKFNHVFRRLYGRGKSAVNPCLAVYCRKNNLGYSRLGLTVGVKLGKAVVRNRTRRRIKEAYRIHEGAFFPGYDIVVVARVRAAHSRYRELERSLLSLADKLGLLRKEGGLIEAPASGLDPGLPHVHLSLPSPLLPVYPHLLGLCPGGGGEIRGVEGGLSRPAPYPQMSALPQAGFH